MTLPEQQDIEVVKVELTDQDLDDLAVIDEMLDEHGFYTVLETSTVMRPSAAYENWRYDEP